MNILENPKQLKELAKKLDSLIKENPNCCHRVMFYMDEKEMRMECILISGKVGYYLTPASCPYFSGEYPYTKEIQHVRRKDSPYAVYPVKELIEMIEKGNFEIK